LLPLHYQYATIGAGYIVSVYHGSHIYDHKAGVFARNDLPDRYQTGKDLFLQQVSDNCNKKGMHEVVYYSNACLEMKTNRISTILLR
jgi:hypothetical protein